MWQKFPEKCLLVCLFKMVWASLQMTQLCSLLWQSNVPLYMCTTTSLSIHLFMDILRCFHVLATVNSVTMNTRTILDHLYWCDGPTVCYTEWSKSKREKQISYLNTNVWNLAKWYRRTYFQGRNRVNMWTQQGKGRVAWSERAALTYIHYHM